MSNADEGLAYPRVFSIILFIFLITKIMCFVNGGDDLNSCKSNAKAQAAHEVGLIQPTSKNKKKKEPCYSVKYNHASKARE